MWEGCCAQGNNKRKPLYTFIVLGSPVTLQFITCINVSLLCNMRSLSCQRLQFCCISKICYEGFYSLSEYFEWKIRGDLGSYK
jgi:hypothetical protein